MPAERRSKMPKINMAYIQCSTRGQEYVRIKIRHGKNATPEQWDIARQQTLDMIQQFDCDIEQRRNQNTE
ncbi:MAG: hypothetical protein MUO31_07935 [Thermodesulfovibrionales bacterium]|nr:hypothetical protein [Thermodesulfovibrionales bacterium]